MSVDSENGKKGLLYVPDFGCERGMGSAASCDVPSAHSFSSKRFWKLFKSIDKYQFLTLLKFKLMKVLFITHIH